MVRRYEESIEVRANDPQPEAFVWRGRLYVVRAVLDHWQERRAWCFCSGLAGFPPPGRAAPAGRNVRCDRG